MMQNERRITEMRKRCIAATEALRDNTFTPNGVALVTKEACDALAALFEEILAEIELLQSELQRETELRMFFERASRFIGQENFKAFAASDNSNSKDVIATCFGVPLTKIKEWVGAERDGRLMVLPIGKIGEYVEWSWDGGTSTQLFMIHNILVCRDGIRYDLGDFAPFVNSKRINRILTRKEAEAALKGEQV